MADYIPAADAEFHAWQHNFVATATGNLAGLGLAAGDTQPRQVSGVASCGCDAGRSFAYGPVKAVVNSAKSLSPTA